LKGACSCQLDLQGKLEGERRMETCINVSMCACVWSETDRQTDRQTHTHTETDNTN
jgi:hypothetical protein